MLCASHIYLINKKKIEQKRERDEVKRKIYEKKKKNC